MTCSSQAERQDVIRCESAWEEHFALFNVKINVK